MCVELWGRGERWRRAVIGLPGTAQGEPGPGADRKMASCSDLLS